MKNLFILLSVVCLGLISCSEKNNYGLGNFDYDASKLIGTWEVTEANDVPWVLARTTFTFGKDGSYESKGEFGSFKGNYKLSDNKVISYVLGEKYITYEVNSLSSDTFIFDVGDVPVKLQLKCKK